MRRQTADVIMRWCYSLPMKKQTNQQLHPSFPHRPPPSSAGSPSALISVIGRITSVSWMPPARLSARPHCPTPGPPWPSCLRIFPAPPWLWKLARTARGSAVISPDSVPRLFVANPRKLHAISRNERKCDRRDAQMLARLARADVALLQPDAVKHEPSGLLGDAQSAGKLARTDSVFGVHNHPESGKPFTSKPRALSSKIVPALTENCLPQSRHFQTLRVARKVALVELQQGQVRVAVVPADRNHELQRPVSAPQSI